MLRVAPVVLCPGGPKNCQLKYRHDRDYSNPVETSKNHKRGWQERHREEDEMADDNIPSVHPYDIYKGFLVIYGIIGSIATVMAYQGWIPRYVVFVAATLFTILLIGVARGVPDDFVSRDSIVRASSFGLVYGAPPGILSVLGLLLVYDNALFFGLGFLLASVMTAVVFPGSAAYESIRPFIISMVVSSFGFVMFGLLWVGPAIDAYAATQNWLAAEDLKLMAVGPLGLLWTMINHKLSNKAFDGYKEAQEEISRAATQ